MNTNRMGLEQTLSDERLELFIRQPLDNGLTRGEQMELAREALARRKASSEPVADVVAWNKPGEERKCDIRWRRFDVAPGPLFAAPQLQTVKVPDGWLLIPAKPSQAHLNSIAMRYRHDFYLLNDAQKDSALATARQMYEECSGMGFFTIPDAEKCHK